MPTAGKTTALSSEKGRVLPRLRVPQSHSPTQPFSSSPHTDTSRPSPAADHGLTPVPSPHPTSTTAVEVPLSERMQLRRLSRIAAAGRRPTLMSSRRETLSHRERPLGGVDDDADEPLIAVKLVPNPEDLTHEEMKVVEERFSQFGPIGSKIQLMEFLCSIGENLSEELLLALLLRMAQENKSIAAKASRRAHKLLGGAASQQAEGSVAPETGGSRTPGRGNHLRLGLRQSLLQRLGVSAENSVGNADLYSDDETSGNSAKTGNQGQTALAHLSHSKIDILLRKHFLRPFFQLSDATRLLTAIKAMVCENRLTDDEAKEVFDALCDESSRAINAEEFRAITKTFSLRLDVDELLREIDEDGSGQIELLEFRHLLGRVGVGANGFGHASSSSPSSRPWISLGAATGRAVSQDNGSVSYNLDEQESVSADASSPPVAAIPVGGLAVSPLQADLLAREATQAIAAAASPQSDAMDSTSPSSNPFYFTGGPRMSVVQHVPSHQPQGGLDRFPSRLLPLGRLATLRPGALTGGEGACSPSVISSLEPLAQVTSPFEAQLRAMRRDFADRDPFEGIEAPRALASYLALRPVERSHIKVRLTKHASQRAISSKDLSHKKQLASKKQQQQTNKSGARESATEVIIPHTTNEPSNPKLYTIDLGDNHNTNQEHQNEDVLLPVESKQQNNNTNNISSASPSKGTIATTRLPPVVAGGTAHRKPFRVEEGVIPSWRENYHLFTHPF